MARKSLGAISPWIVSVMIAFSGLWLTGCSDDPPKEPLVPVELSFTRYLPIYLNVANVDFVEEYKSPGREPNVEHLLPLTPAEAMRTWIKDRVRAVGLNHTLQVIIRDAKVVAVELPAQGEGVQEYFSGAPDRRYDARLEVELRVYGDTAMSQASIVVVATQSSTISKAATVYERKAAFMDILYRLMESSNAELEKQIFKYFTPYIMYAQTP